ncbi:MAG: hypothetical protein AB7P34_10835 [Vicinamibacterales bacterium]
MRGVRPDFLVWLLIALAAMACDDNGTSPSQAALALTVSDPVVARFDAGSNALVAEFPVTISDPAGGGTLAAIVTTVLNQSRGAVVVRNERPNASFAFPATVLPAGGSLTVQAGAAFTATPPRDEIVLVVEARLSDGRVVQRTVGLVQQF